MLEAIVTRIPPPKGDRDAPLKAMLVDSWYDPYLGVVILVRVIDGAIRKGQNVAFMAAGTTHLVDRVGAFRPKIEQLPELGRRRDRLHHRPDQGHHRDQGRRHHHRRPPARRRGAARLQAGPAGRLLRPVPGRRRRFREACASRSPSSASTTPASASRWRRRRPWASASAAASSASSTSRSSRSG